MINVFFILFFVIHPLAVWKISQTASYKHRILWAILAVLGGYALLYVGQSWHFYKTGIIFNAIENPTEQDLRRYAPNGAGYAFTAAFGWIWSLGYFMINLKIGRMIKPIPPYLSPLRFNNFGKIVFYITFLFFQSLVIFFSLVAMIPLIFLRIIIV
jgi:hypothetical protein